MENYRAIKHYEWALFNLKILYPTEEQEWLRKKFYDENGNEVTGVKEKKLFYKKWWFWLIVVIVLIALNPTGDV